MVAGARKRVGQMEKISKQERSLKLESEEADREHKEHRGKISLFVYF